MSNQSDNISLLVDNVQAYCATGPQEFHARQTLRLTDGEETELHHLAWLGVVPLEDYYEVQDIKLADNLWLNPKEGMPRFRTIDQVRAWVCWKETRTFVTADGREITETVYNRFLPVFRYIRRTISQHPNKALFETISHVEEVEFANLHPSQNFDATLTKLVTELQADAAEHLKWSVQGALSPEQTEHLQQLVLLGKADVQLIYTLSQGSRKESKPYSLLEAYQGLLQHAMEEVTRQQDKRNRQSYSDDIVHDTSAQQLEDILSVLKQAFLKWDPVRAPLPAWVKFKLNKETQGFAHKEYRPLEQQPEKRTDIESAELRLDFVPGKRRSERSLVPNIDPSQAPIPLEEQEEPEDTLYAVRKAMREIMIRELGEEHYQRRFIDNQSAAVFSKEVGTTMTRATIAKREERARKVVLAEITAKFGANILQSLFRG